MADQVVEALRPALKSREKDLHNAIKALTAFGPKAAPAVSPTSAPSRTIATSTSARALPRLCSPSRSRGVFTSPRPSAAPAGIIRVPIPGMPSVSGSAPAMIRSWPSGWRSALACRLSGLNRAAAQGRKTTWRDRRPPPISARVHPVMRGDLVGRQIGHRGVVRPAEGVALVQTAEVSRRPSRETDQRRVDRIVEELVPRAPRGASGGAPPGRRSGSPGDGGP